MSLLSVNDFSLVFKQNNPLIPTVDHISFQINEGETLALVGESGSGKSVTALSILKLLPSHLVEYPSGDIQFNGQSLLHANNKMLRKIRGNQIGMIFQEPMVSLNPLHTIEKQLYDVLATHRGIRRSVARTEILSYLERVGIRQAHTKLSAYPHQLSGGERQRVMIAMAILTQPKLLIADEPTTALDAHVQKQIIELLKSLKHELNMSLLFITHNLNLVKQLADNVAVMKQGKIIEQNNRHRIFVKPQNDYTQLLLNSRPSGDPVPLPINSAILMNINHLSVDVITKKRLFRHEKKRLIDNVSFTLHQGEAVGVVGESGSGKTTTALAMTKLIDSTGDIIFDGCKLQNLSPKKWLPFRRQIQIVFQDPFSSLNPRFTIEQIISEGLLTYEKLNHSEMTYAVTRIMHEVGLDPLMRYRYPHEFSGGQRQRIAIARALILKPQILILDEPTSALDYTVQKQIIELLKSLQRKHQLTYLVISHDLEVIRALCHQIIIMKEGKIVEQGARDVIFHSPSNSYTKLLISLLPKPISTPEANIKTNSQEINWNEALLYRKASETI